jgi:DNA repair exonuclease SbcCD ATPase subunit
MSRALVLGAAIIVVAASTAAAQTGAPDLAAIARQAEAAKASAPKAKKTYTNADLGPDGMPPAAEATPQTGFMSSSLGRPVSAEEMLELSKAKVAEDVKQNEPDEAWIAQAAAIRRQVEKLAPRLAELKSREKSPNATMQQRADQQIADIEKQIEGFKKRWAGLEDAARTAKVSLALLMPAPAFPQ